jgi:hypothetical protein
MSCGKPCNCDTYRTHLLSISVASAATPTRRPEAHRINQREQGWHTDMPAYKRLRADGLQPPRIDGCADLEKRATEPVEIETGRVAYQPKSLQRFHEQNG